MDGIPEIETERLLLRPWKATDHEPFAALNADPQVMEFFPSILSRIESDAFADRCQSLILERGWGFWAVEVRETGAFIGLVGLHIPVAEMPFSPCVEIGWRLAQDRWGRGYATEAAREALHHGFARLELMEIVAFTAIRNLRSRAVMERLGMLEEGYFEHPLIPKGHPLRVHVLYRMPRERFTPIPGSPTSFCRPTS